MNFRDFTRNERIGAVVSILWFFLVWILGINTGDIMDAVLWSIAPLLAGWGYVWVKKAPK